MTRRRQLTAAQLKQAALDLVRAIPSTIAELTGTLGIGNGGTGQTTATEAFDALAPGTTKGDIVVHNGSDNVRLAVGSNDQVLIADSAEASGVKWGAAAGGGGADVKSGSASVTEGSTASVTFNTAFSSSPNVVATCESGEYGEVEVSSITTGGFTLSLEKIGGGAGSSYTVHWIATDAGNP